MNVCLCVYITKMTYGQLCTTACKQIFVDFYTQACVCVSVCVYICAHISLVYLFCRLSGLERLRGNSLYRVTRVDGRTRERPHPGIFLWQLCR